MDEESQVQELQDALDSWKSKRNASALSDNDKDFDEMQAKVEQA